MRRRWIVPVIGFSLLVALGAPRPAQGAAAHGEPEVKTLTLAQKVARLIKGGEPTGEGQAVAKSGRFEVRLTYRPAPITAGRRAEFRITIVDPTQKDPLLGEAVPVEAAKVAAGLKGTGAEETAVSVRKEEAGVYSTAQDFPTSGRLVLNFRGSTAAGEPLQAEFPLKVRRDPAAIRLSALGALLLFLAVASLYLARARPSLRRVGWAGAGGVFTIAIVLAGTLVIAARQGSREEAGHAGDNHEDESPAASKAVQVPQEMRERVLKTEKAVLGTIRDHLRANGFVEVPVDRIVNVSPRVGGKVVRINVKPGDRVEPGQVLALIDSPELAQAQANYRQAKARLDLGERELERRQRMASLGAFTSRPLEEARVEYARAQSELHTARSELEVAQKNKERVEELVKDGIRSRRDLEVAEAAYQSALAKVRQAEARAAEAQTFLRREEALFKAGFRAAREVEEAEAEHRRGLAQFESATEALKLLHVSASEQGGITEITCPISGVVADRKINLGEVVGPGTIICTVVDLRTVWVDAEVYETDLARLRMGMPVEVEVKAYPEKTFRGKVIFISSLLDQARRTAKVRTEVSNPGEELRPGMLAEVRLITGERPRVVLIPESAILDDVGRKLVYVQEGDAFHERDVKTGVSIGGKTEIMEGLKPGETVVTRGTWELRTQIERGMGAPAVGGHGVHGAEEKPTRGAY